MLAAQNVSLEDVEAELARREVRYTAGLLDLMQAYARIRTKDEFRPYVMDRENLVTMEEALDALRNRIGLAGDWTDLMSWLPQGWVSHPERRRSATASTFAASLELAKAGKLQLRQDETFAPIKVRRAQP